MQQLDLVANRDYSDVFTYRLSDGRWTQLTRTAWGDEGISGISPDGKEALVVVHSARVEIRRVSVPELVSGTR